MNSDFIEQLGGSGRASWQSLRELGEINATAMQRLAEIQLKFATLGIRNAMDQAQVMTSSAGYAELLAAETELAGTFGNRLMEITREAADVFEQIRDDINAWMKKGLQAAPSPAPEPAAAKPAKATARRGASKKAA